jgi:hypothetical protein
MSFFKVIRIIRFLRPLSMIYKNGNLALSLKALQITVPAISSLLVIVILLLVIVAIFGINLLKGRAFYCDTSNTVLSKRDVEQLIMTT